MSGVQRIVFFRLCPGPSRTRSRSAQRSILTLGQGLRPTPASLLRPYRLPYTWLGGAHILSQPPTSSTVSEQATNLSSSHRPAAVGGEGITSDAGSRTLAQHSTHHSLASPNDGADQVHGFGAARLHQAVETSCANVARVHVIQEGSVEFPRESTSPHEAEHPPGLPVEGPAARGPRLQRCRHAIVQSFLDI